MTSMLVPVGSTIQPLSLSSPIPVSASNSVPVPDGIVISGEPCGGANVTCATCTMLIVCMWVLLPGAPYNSLDGKCVKKVEMRQEFADLQLIFSPSVCGFFHLVDEELASDPKVGVGQSPIRLGTIRSIKLMGYRRHLPSRTITDQNVVVRTRLNVTSFNMTKVKRRTVLRIDALLQMNWEDNRLAWKYPSFPSKLFSNFKDSPQQYLPYTEMQLWWPRIPEQFSSDLTSFRRTEPGGSFIRAFQNGSCFMDIPVKIACPCELVLLSWPFDVFVCKFPLNLDPSKKQLVDEWIGFKSEYGANSTNDSFVISTSLVGNPEWNLIKAEAVNTSSNCKSCQKPFLLFLFSVQGNAPFFRSFVVLSILMTVALGIFALFLEHDKNKLAKIIIAFVDMILILILIFSFKALRPYHTDGVPVLFGIYLWTMLILGLFIIISLTFSYYSFPSPNNRIPPCLVSFFGNPEYLNFLLLGHLLKLKEDGIMLDDLNENGLGLGSGEGQPQFPRLAFSDQNQNESFENDTSDETCLYNNRGLEDVDLKDTHHSVADHGSQGQGQGQGQHGRHQYRYERMHNESVDTWDCEDNVEWSLIASAVDRIILMLYLAGLVILTFVFLFFLIV